MQNLNVLGDNIGSVEYIQHCGSDKMIVNAARVSFARDTANTEFDASDERLLRYLIRHNHGTPLEHNLITFKIKAPLYVVQEMLRHRHLSFNQESHRYIEPGVKAGRFEYYLPVQMRRQSKSNKQSSEGGFDEAKNAELRVAYQIGVDYARDAYVKLIADGVAREVARGVLPHSTYASLYLTCNVRSLLHFLDLRLAPDAQWEIRQYAAAMADIGKELFPVTFRVMEEVKGEE